MVRKEYWDKAKEIIDFCNSEELKVLSQQAAKELNRRIDSYNSKLDKSESHAEKVRKRKSKERAIKNASKR